VTGHSQQERRSGGSDAAGGKFLPGSPAQTIDGNGVLSGRGRTQQVVGRRSTAVAESQDGHGRGPGRFRPEIALRKFMSPPNSFCGQCPSFTRKPRERLGLAGPEWGEPAERQPASKPRRREAGSVGRPPAVVVPAIAADQEAGQEHLSGRPIRKGRQEGLEECGVRLSRRCSRSFMTTAARSRSIAASEASRTRGS
jgi:hypothetical protein